MRNAVNANGVLAVRTPNGIGVAFETLLPDVVTPVRVDIAYRGKPWQQVFLSPLAPPWRDFYGREVDHLKLVVEVHQGNRLLAILGPPPEDDLLPFMRLNGEQRHITESYVSVPPALTITDEVGAVWTLGFDTARKDQSPDGEYAFNVLRDGIEVCEIASRIERRGGKIRVFTKNGWKVWNQVGKYFV